MDEKDGSFRLEQEGFLFSVEQCDQLQHTCVLIVGASGVGVEIAKNLLLDGHIGAILLHDDTLVRIQDLGTNYLLKEADVGKPRAQCVVDNGIGEINPQCNVTVHTGPVNKDTWDKCQVVVYTNDFFGLDHLIEADEY
jgi:ubiquitin-activating enzyme E1